MGCTGLVRTQASCLQRTSLSFLVVFIVESLSVEQPRRVSELLTVGNLNLRAGTVAAHGSVKST